MRLRPRLLLVIGLFLAVLFLHPAPKAYAHFLASDGTMEAVLHVEPDDDPIPGNPQTLYLILSDATNRFKLSNCVCKLSVGPEGQTTYSAPLTVPPAGQQTIYSTNGLPFTFPAPGIYDVTATGRPITPDSFQPFNLFWSIEINQPPKLTNSFSSSTFLIYFAMIFGALLLIGIIVFVFT